MMNKIYKILGSIFLATQLMSCGANTDSIDILNSTNIPEIGSFASTPTYGAGSAYTSVNPFILFTTTGFGSYLAPARGFVAEVGTSNLTGFTGTTFVTIIHSGRVATRVHGIQSIVVRPGDVVYAGGTVGLFYTTSQVAFQVLVDGASVCPLSYFSPTMRSQLFSNPCQY